MQFPEGRYWWMVSNPDTFKTWCLRDITKKEVCTWSLYNDKGNRRGTVDAFRAIRKDDWILGYVCGSSHPHGVYSLLQCTHELTDKPFRGEDYGLHYRFKKIRDLDQYIPWEVFANEPGLKNARMVTMSNSGSLFGFTDKEQVALLKLLRGYRGRRYWTYASGNSGEDFDADLQDGVMGLGQNDLGDLHKYGNSVVKIAAAIRRASYNVRDGSGSARYLLDFRDNMRPGDVVFVKSGRYRFAGVGIVTGDYHFNSRRKDGQHVRKVKWIRHFDRKSPCTFSRTTLTSLSDQKKIKALLSAADLSEHDLAKYDRSLKRKHKPTMARQLTHAKAALSPQALAARLKRISRTEHLRELVQREGQRELREVLLSKRGQCEVTGLRLESLLVASHIKDWKKCTRDERLDLENVLLLARNYDAAFDRKLISFGPDGKIVKSETVSWEDLAALGIKKSARIARPRGKRAKYLEWHRAHMVKKTKA